MGKLVRIPDPDRVALSKKTATQMPASRSRAILLLAALVAFCAAGGYAWWRRGKTAEVARRAEEIMSRPVSVSRQLVDDSGLSEEEFRERHAWFYEREEEILARAPESLKATHRPVPEIYESRSGVVKLKLRHVRWEPREDVPPEKPVEMVSDYEIVAPPPEPEPPTEDAEADE
jgi:hypothetical protein